MGAGAVAIVAGAVAMVAAGIVVGGAVAGAAEEAMNALIQPEAGDDVDVLDAVDELAVLDTRRVAVLDVRCFVDECWGGYHVRGLALEGGARMTAT